MTEDNGAMMKDWYLDQELNNTKRFDDSEGNKIAHAGFERAGELMSYIAELESELKGYKDLLRGTETKQGLLERREEISERVNEIAKLYPNMSFDEIRKDNKEFANLENEFYDLVDLEDEYLNKITELSERIKSCKTAKMQWIKDDRRVLKEKNAPYEQMLENKKRELDNAKQRLHHLETVMMKPTHNEYTNDAGINNIDALRAEIEDLRDLIAGLEKEIEKLEEYLRNFDPRKPSRMEGESLITDPEPKKVTVTFDTRGGYRDGITYDPIEVEKGTVVLAPEDPELDKDHEFAGWELNGEEYDFSKPVTENITLKARYKEIERHKVAYFDEKGEELGYVMVRHGESIPLIKELEDKRFKNFAGWELANEMFDPRTPIIEDIDLCAKYKFNWKKTAAIAAGVATGALTYGTDALLTMNGMLTGGAVSFGTSAVMAAGTAITQFKLKHHKEKEDVESLTGLRKAGAKLKNYFREEKNIKNLRTFFGLATASTLIAGIGQKLNPQTPQANTTNNISDINDNTQLNPEVTQTTPQNPTPQTVEQYVNEKGPITNIYDTANESLSGFNAETPLPEFEGSIPGRAYNPENGMWMNIDKTTTMEDVISKLGTDKPQLDFMKNGQSLGWVDIENSFGGIKR